MYNLEQDANKSCQPGVPFEDLQNLDRVGFKLIPLREDSVTPNVPSTNDIYNNSEYWTEKKLQKDHHLFYNVATALGKSHVKDESGKNLFLNVIDIDSDAVSTRLAVISKDGKDIYLIDELRKSTFVVKTKKRLGYHIYWLSHNQNKPVRTRDCKRGCEFEIKTDNSTGLSTLPPSRHRDDVDFRYQNVGQNAIAVRDKLYDGLVDLLSDFIKEKPSSIIGGINPSLNESINGITSNESTQIASILVSAYCNGNRNDIIFALSGFLCHRGLVLDAAETVVNELCKITGDEDIENRLVVVRNTYQKANEGKPITSRNELFEILERVGGMEPANQIIKDISQLLNKTQDPVVSQLDSSIRNELSGHIFETVCYDPPTLVVAHATKKQIITCKILRDRNQNAIERQDSLRLGEVILNAFPEEIIRYESPLNKDQIKYKIKFTTPFGDSFTTQPKSLDKIVLNLKMRSLTYKPRTAEESLNAVINGAQRAQRVLVVRQIETPGFYYVDSKIVASNITMHQPSIDEIKRCIEFLTELVNRSKHPDILVTEIKWGIIAPFNFVFKQLSEEGSERWIPWLYLNGHTKTSKTTDGTIVLSIYRKQKNKLSLASTNNVARLGEAISHDTFPVLIDEVKLDPKIHSDLVEAIKHAVQGQTARTKLLISSEPIHIPALSACIFTSNHQLPSDPALRRRFLNLYHHKDDKPTEDEISNFQSFLKSGRNSLGTLGDFASYYLLSNQELITNDRNDWQTIAKTVLEEFCKAANLSPPDWIDMTSIGNQIEDIEAEEEQIIRSFFVKKINDAFSKNYRSIEPWKDQQIDSVTNKNGPLEMRLNFCLDNRLISFMLRKSTNPNEILITNDILKEFRDAGIDFIQTFTDLARMLGAEIKPTKLDRKSARLIITSVPKLIGFMDPESS
jgi:hypothetical protein